MSDKRKAIATHIEAILKILGLSPDDPLLEKTPGRVADIYLEALFDGMDENNRPNLVPYLEPVHHHEEIILEAIPFVSMCEHHLVPMIGTVRIAFMPADYLLGFSRFYDLVRFYAHRPQLQERFTRQLTDCLIELLKTEDVSVQVKATHFCVLARTEGELTSTVETRAARGIYSPLAVSKRNT